MKPAPGEVDRRVFEGRYAHKANPQFAHAPSAQIGAYPSADLIERRADAPRC